MPAVLGLVIRAVPLMGPQLDPEAMPVLFEYAHPHCQGAIRIWPLSGRRPGHSSSCSPTAGSLNQRNQAKVLGRGDWLAWSGRAGGRLRVRRPPAGSRVRERGSLQDDCPATIHRRNQQRRPGLCGCSDTGGCVVGFGQWSWYRRAVQVGVTGVAARRPKPRTVTVVLTAAALGVLAFMVDAVHGAPGRIMATVVSSGLAWGLAALLTGRTATGRRSAVTDATVLLVAATLVYYLLILVVSRRWSGGTLQDGSSGDGHGLRSLTVMTTAWLLTSMVAGPVFGLLGQMTRTMPVPGAALAAGIACGLLSSQGWQEITAVPPGQLITAAGGPDTGFFRAAGAAELAEVLLPFAVLAWLATDRRLWRAWPILLIAMISTATLGALFWHLLRTTANQLG